MTRSISSGDARRTTASTGLRRQRGYPSRHRGPVARPRRPGSMTPQSRPTASAPAVVAIRRTVREERSNVSRCTPSQEHRGAFSITLTVTSATRTQAAFDGERPTPRSRYAGERPRWGRCCVGDPFEVLRLGIDHVDQQVRVQIQRRVDIGGVRFAGVDSERNRALLGSGPLGGETSSFAPLAPNPSATSSTAESSLPKMKSSISSPEAASRSAVAPSMPHPGSRETLRYRFAA